MTRALFMRPSLSAGVTLILLVLGLAGCSRPDAAKDGFMSQCAITSAMKDACSCMYDEIAAEMPPQKIEAAVRKNDGSPRLAKVMAQAASVCTKKYRQR